MLQERTANKAFRDPLNYALALFGVPGPAPWAWRFEGHHVSLSLTIVAGVGIAVTPHFLGANPSRARWSRTVMAALPGCWSASRRWPLSWSTDWARRHCGRCSSPPILAIVRFAVSWFLYSSRPGLVLRAVGESPVSAHAIGYPVIRIRYLATLFGGAMAGVAGAYLSLVYAPLWLEGMTAGRGWIALALVVFATWRPARVVFGAYLFGGITITQFFAQGAGIAFASQAMSALPYLATIIVLVLISRNPAMIRLNSPDIARQAVHADV